MLSADTDFQGFRTKRHVYVLEPQLPKKYNKIEERQREKVTEQSGDAKLPAARFYVFQPFARL